MSRKCSQGNERDSHNGRFHKSWRSLLTCWPLLRSDLDRPVMIWGYPVGQGVFWFSCCWCFLHFFFSVEAELTLERVTVYPMALLLITKSALQTSSESAVVPEEYFWPLLLLFSWSPLVVLRWTQHSPLPWPFCPLLLILSLRCAGQDL